MTEPHELQLSFAKRNLIVVGLVVCLVAAALALIVPPLSSPQAYESFLKSQAQSTRCRLCGIGYGQALTTTTVVVGGVAALLLAAAGVAVLRAFGPPALTVTSDGTFKYRLPWRTRTFVLRAGTRIVVGPAFKFEPPGLADDGSSVPTINLRTRVTNLSTAEIAHRLAAMRSDWKVERR